MHINTIERLCCPIFDQSRWAHFDLMISILPSPDFCWPTTRQQKTTECHFVYEWILIESPLHMPTNGSKHITHLNSFELTLEVYSIGLHSSHFLSHTQTINLFMYIFDILQKSEMRFFLLQRQNISIWRLLYAIFQSSTIGFVVDQLPRLPA